MSYQIEEYDGTQYLVVGVHPCKHCGKERQMLENPYTGHRMPKHKGLAATVCPTPKTITLSASIEVTIEEYDKAMSEMTSRMRGGPLERMGAIALNEAYDRYCELKDEQKTQQFDRMYEQHVEQQKQHEKDDL